MNIETQNKQDTQNYGLERANIDNYENNNNENLEIRNRSNGRVKKIVTRNVGNTQRRWFK